MIMCMLSKADIWACKNTNADVATFSVALEEGGSHI